MNAEFENVRKKFIITIFLNHYMKVKKACKGIQRVLYI